MFFITNQYSISDNTSNSVAPPNITQTQQDPQAKIQTATPKHDAHPHCPNIIKDDDGNQPHKLTHKNQPLGLGLLPQRNNSTLHHIPPDFATSPRVTLHRQRPGSKRDKRHNHISIRHFKNMTRTHIIPTSSRTTTAINLRNFHKKTHS